MNREEIYDLIERYFDGALSDAELQAVEHRLATDAEFRAEVEFHRAMHISLGDMGNFRLRTALDNLLRDPPSTDDALTPKTVPPPVPVPRWLQLAGIIVLLAVVGILVWRWLTLGDATIRPNSTEPSQNQVVDTTSSPQQNTHSDSASLPVRQNSNKPIAMADPADFVPNPVLEAGIGDIVRGNGITVQLTSPPIGTSFQSQNGQVILPIRGVAVADTLPTDQPLELMIYSNRPEAWDKKQPSISIPFSVKFVGGNTYQVDFRTTINLHPGLYYIVIGQKRIEGGHQPLWIGKFIVQEK